MAEKPEFPTQLHPELIESTKKYLDELQREAARNSRSGKHVEFSVPSSTPSKVTVDNNHEITGLSEEQKLELTAELEDPVLIKFSGDKEDLRNEKKTSIVPNAVFRVSTEGSVVMSKYTSCHNWIQNRGTPGQWLHPDNAYQALSLSPCRTKYCRQRVARHLIWSRTNPSPYISVTNSYSHAIGRIEWLYHTSRHIGHRSYITKISTDGFLAARVIKNWKIRCAIMQKVDNKEQLVACREFLFVEEVPIWVRDTRKPEDRVDITGEELDKLGLETWMAAKEICDPRELEDPQPKGSMWRAYEFFACGRILKSSIIAVMPYDGRFVYDKPTTRIITSLYPWVWNREIEQWAPNPEVWQAGKNWDAEHIRSPSPPKRGVKRRFLDEWDEEQFAKGASEIPESPKKQVGTNPVDAHSNDIPSQMGDVIDHESVHSSTSTSLEEA